MSLDRQPVLGDALVRLRPLAASDWSALFAVASDPLIWAGHPAHDRWQEPVFCQFFDDALASGGALIARDGASGQVIGSSRYDFTRAGPGEVEIGWHLHPDSHGHGYATEAAELLLARGFEAGAVVVQTGKPDAFYARVTSLAATDEVGLIHEVTSPDDNLQAVFQYLVK